MMAASAVGSAGSFRQVGKEKTFSWDEESGLHVTNRVREYVFSPSNDSASDLSTSGNTVNILTEKKGHDPAASSSSLADSVSTAADAMRLGIVGHPVAALSGALALAVLQRLVGKRKRRLRTEVENDAGDHAKDADSVSPVPAILTPSVGASTAVELQIAEAQEAPLELAVIAVEKSASPAPASSQMEEAEACPEPGTPRSAHTVSSAGGGSLLPSPSSFSMDESQNQRLLSHRKEVVMKLRHQLQSRDEMILDMQQQLAAQEHFTRESRSIVSELEEQLKQALDGGQKLGIENQKLAEERERLEKELEEERGERARLAKENGRLNKSVMELEQEDDRYALELEGAVKNLEQERGKLEAAVRNIEQERGKLEVAVMDLEQERDGLESTIDEQRGSLQELGQEREQLQHTLQEREKALSDAESRLKSSGSPMQQEDVAPKLQDLVAEKERLVTELEGAKQESTANAAREKAAVEKVEAVEKDLARFQKMLKGKDRLLEGYEKERTHLTAVLKDLEQKLEVKQRELEALSHNPASAPTEDVQSSNDSDGPRSMAGASPSRGEEAQSQPRGPRNMHLMKSFDNPLSELSPEQSPNSPERRLSVSKPGRLYDSRLLDDSVYPSPNGVLENRPRQLSTEHRRSLMKPANGSDASQLRSDVDALAQELSDRFRSVSEKKKEAGRLVENLRRQKDLIVDLQRKIGKEEELGLGEDDWLNGGTEHEETWAKQAEPAQAAILAKKLEQVALQQAMDEKLAELQQQESEITRLKGRVASLVGKVNGVEKVEPSAVFQRHSDVLGEELAQKLAFQEQQAAEALAEVQRLSATFQRGSPLFAKAQDELLRKSLTGLDLKAGRINGIVDGQSSAGQAERRYTAADGWVPTSNGFGQHHGGGPSGQLSDSKQPAYAATEEHARHYTAPGSNGGPAEPDSPTSDHAPRDELARLTVEVERELSQDFAKRLNGDLPHGTRAGSQGSGDMDVEEDDEESVGEAEGLREEQAAKSKEVEGEGELDSSLAEMLESTLDDMVRMCTPASSQANSPFPNQ